jgi:hypothetical protein
MANYGSWTLAGSASTFPGAGYYSGVTPPSAAIICASNTVAGVAGTASCLSFPAVTVSGELSWGTITSNVSTKTLTFTVSGAGANFLKVNFSGPGVSAFTVTDVSATQTASTSADIVLGFSSNGVTSKTLTFRPTYQDTSTKTMTLTMTDAAGNSIVKTADVTFSNPILSASLVGWFRADTITGLSNGDTVATWINSADNTKNATQSTSGSRPTFVTNGKNGYPIVRFAEGHSMTSTLVPATGTGPRTIVAISKVGTFGWNQDRYVTGWGAGVNGLYMLSVNAAWPSWATVYWGSWHYSGTAWSSDHQVVVTSYDGSTNRMWVNGSATSTPTSTTALATANSGLIIGSGYAGDIAELIFYNTSIDSTQREAIECWAANYWALGAMGHSCP